jgi:hypothetical protein
MNERTGAVAPGLSRARAVLAQGDTPWNPQTALNSAPGRTGGTA